MPDEAREFALLCPRCGEENPPGFPVCWSCNADLPAPPELMAEAALPTPPQADPSARAARRKRLLVEVAVVLAVVWLPLAWLAFLSGEDVAPGSAPPSTALTLYWLLDQVGFLALLGYLAWLDGDWRRFFGLRRPQAVDLLWAAGVVIAIFVSDIIARRLAMALLFADEVLFAVESSEPPGPEAGPLWIWLLYLSIWALFEEAFYRAYLWKRFSELSGRPALSIVVASLLFTLPHGYSLEGSLSVFFTGLALGWIFRARQSLWAVVLGHLAYNLFLTS